MTWITHLGAILCVGMIAAGQVLFKMVALSIKGSGTVLSREIFFLGGTAIAIYGLATLFWIALLREAPLGRLYPYMALSFMFVALASWAIFHEAITPGQMAGLALIVGGLIVIAVS